MRRPPQGHIPAFERLGGGRSSGSRPPSRLPYPVHPQQFRILGPFVLPRSAPCLLDSCADPLRKILRRRRQLEPVLVLLPFDDPGKGIEAHRPFFLVADKIPDLLPVLPDESAAEGNTPRREPVGDLAVRRTPAWGG